MVAHRAGNDLGALRRAEELGANLVEADVRLYRGRAVVRHLKTIGPIPLYWDRWTVASPFNRYLRVPELLGQAADETELMLDLKGPRRRLSELVLEELRPYLGQRPLTVCARWWRLLETFEGAPVRRIASVGSARELRAVLRRFAERRIDGVSVHERLLDEATVADIRRVTELVLTWPANVPSRARALLEMGVDGLISDRVDAIAPIVAGR
ncbi:MAG TPA: glycerophosphodiester phosphodiesterase [Gaiellaceae bacterium]|nr:glycerophosphodiester phosphodiesterase [Gaiellaceae bacterium]